MSCPASPCGGGGGVAACSRSNLRLKRGGVAATASSVSKPGVRASKPRLMPPLAGTSPLWRCRLSRGSLPSPSSRSTGGRFSVAASSARPSRPARVCGDIARLKACIAAASSGLGRPNESMAPSSTAMGVALGSVICSNGATCRLPSCKYPSSSNRGISGSSMRVSSPPGSDSSMGCSSQGTSLGPCDNVTADGATLATVGSEAAVLRAIAFCTSRASSSNKSSFRKTKRQSPTSIWPKHPNLIPAMCSTMEPTIDLMSELMTSCLFKPFSQCAAIHAFAKRPVGPTNCRSSIRHESVGSLALFFF
mmetsp:Transcript_66025/g.123130  ORF Transcript_66025/g.123130 Transcript_66025/m.123130 type:complete len:306 (+) Transcript_66025:944-1861(+)